MLSYLPDVADASRTPGSPSAGTPAGTVVVRAVDLLVRGGKTVTAGNAVPSAGELAVFCRPVVTAPGLVRRDGSVAVDGWLPDFVRLGELERHLGDGVIEDIVAAALAQGGCGNGERRRIMSYPLVIHLMIAMALMPDGSYCESLARLAGLLADIAFALEWHVPTEKVVTDWRVLGPADVMGGPVLAGGRAAHRGRRAVGGAAGRDDGARRRRDAGEPRGHARRTGPCSARPGPGMIPRRSRKPIERAAVESAMGRVSAWNRRLTSRALDGLGAIPGITIYGPRDPARRTSLVAFNAAGRDPVAVAEGLNRAGVESRAGCHCATLAHHALELTPRGSCRLSFYLYNTLDEVDQAVAAAAAIAAGQSRPTTPWYRRRSRPCIPAASSANSALMGHVASVRRDDHDDKTYRRPDT